MDANLPKAFKAAVVIDKAARAPTKPTIEPSPYSSPFVTLCVGPESAQQVKYSVHRDVLVHIPFFKAALRPNAFIEGAENKITFEEEDPAVFGKLVEFIYVGDFSSRGKHPYTYTIQRLLPDSPEEHYDANRHSCGLACGTHISTSTTHALFETTVLVLCLADRYALQDLVTCCLHKLQEFPIGTKEVAVLTKHVLQNIHEGNAEVYHFLQNKFSLFRARLGQCETFQALQRSDDIALIKGLLRLMTPIHPLSGASLGQVGWGKCFFALCNEDVVAESSHAKWAADGSSTWNVAVFGAALKGEILITNGECDKWGFFLAGHPKICSTDAWLSFPATSFDLLDNIPWADASQRGGRSWVGTGAWRG